MEEKLNWDKLFKHLENEEKTVPDAGELNQEELEMLLLAEEMNMRLNRIDPEKQFPVQMGWEELQVRYEMRRKKNPLVLKINKWYSLTAAAAVLLMVVGSVWWFQVRQTEVVKSRQSSASGIKLILPDGEQVELGGEQSRFLAAFGADLKGNTLVYKKEAELAPLENEQLSMNTLEVPYGRQTKLELSDGTVVWVNAGSKLSYPTRFAKSKRELTLEGEAFFEVHHDVRRPFTVRVKGLDVIVLGTAFNVNTFGPSTTTALVKGKVRLNAGSKSLVLLPGELCDYSENGNVLSKAEQDLRLYTAWKDDDIYFDNNTLEEIAFRLKREYNVRFQFEDPELADLHFTIDMPKAANVQAVLANIKLSTNQIDFVMKGDVVHVKRR